MTVTSKLRGWSKEAINWVQKRFSLRNLESRTPTFVYQMGKVGSSTVVRTLDGIPVAAPVVRIHSLNPAKVRRNIQTLRSSLGYLREHVITSQTLVSSELGWGEFPCTVITLTREPVGRAVSFAFQDWKRQLPGVTSLRELRPEQMMELVMNKLQPGSIHADPGRWFDRELKSVFDIDVMTVPYDFDQGYVQFKRGPVDVLVIRMEDLNRSLATALSDLYNLDPQVIQVRRSNVGKDKAYADLLAQVKERMTIPERVSRRVLNTEYARHFYGPDIDDLREKWEKDA